MGGRHSKRVIIVQGPKGPVEMERGPDVDLEKEEIFVRPGVRLTEKLAAQLAKDAVAHHRKVRGELSDKQLAAMVRVGETKTPIAIRIDPKLLTWYREEAARQGIGYQTLIHNTLWAAAMWGDLLRTGEK